VRRRAAEERESPVPEEENGEENYERRTSTREGEQFQRDRQGEEKESLREGKPTEPFTALLLFASPFLLLVLLRRRRVVEVGGGQRIYIY
jgi:hypothetical protein